MRRAKWCLPLLLSAALWAQTAPPSQQPTGKSSTTKSTTTKSKKAALPKKPVAPPMNPEIQALRRAIADQQKAIEAQNQAMEAQKQVTSTQQAQIQQLQQQLQTRDQAVATAQQTAQQAQSASEKVAAKLTTYDQLQSDVKDAKTTAASASAKVAEEQKRVSTIENIVSRFRFSGDIRVRQEDFFQSRQDICVTANTPKGCTPRIRERIRVRLGIEGKAGEDFVGGLALATGTIYDPTSTNETLTSSFERKNITLDRGYITYAPKAYPWLQVTGGKFAATWIRTGQTFDGDLNPEGFSEKFSFDIKGNSFLKNITFTGLQLLYNEVAAPTALNSTACVAGQQFCANGLNTQGADSFAIGGQVSARLRPAKWITIVPSYTILSWRNENTLLNQASTVTGSTALMGSTPVPTSTNFGPNGLTNDTVTIGTAANGASIRNYSSKFLYSDFILDSTISTGAARWPIRLVAEYMNNLNAASHPHALVCTNSSCSTTATVLATNLGRQSHLYKAEAFFGQLKNRGDIQLSYGWWRQEQDSVLAAFNESDQRAPTNILQHLFTAQYLLRNNITLGASYWYGRTLNAALLNSNVNSPAGIALLTATERATGVREPYLNRMQFDIVYKF